MATLLLQSYSPGPSKGILLNPSPAASPAYHPACLPALVPSNSSLSSSASSSAQGDTSDYFSKSSSPSPGPSHSCPAPRNTHLNPHPKPRNGSNPSTVRRIRFAPLPEPRRDDDMLPPVFLDDDSDAHPEQSLTLSSALAAASMTLSAPGDADLSKRTRNVSTSTTSSPAATRRCLPSDSLLLCSHHSSSEAAPGTCAEHDHPPALDAQRPTAPSDCGQDWDIVGGASPSLPALSLSQSSSSECQSPRKATKWSKMLKPLLGRSSSPHPKMPLARAFSPEEVAAINGEAPRGRSTGLLGVMGSRDSSVSRERRDSDFGLPLHRWTSEGGPGAGLPIGKKKRGLLFGGGTSAGGVPLERTQSLTSLSGKDEKKGAPKAKPTAVTNGGRKQQRMLNGRVYGARRKPNANPFANVRTDEPEFVEWGYGGMGSVKTSAGQSSIWQRVQAGNDAAGIAPKSTTEEDDGSGMTWVKRRKEQREREKKEREEREKAAAEAKGREAEDERSSDDVEVTTMGKGESEEKTREESEKLDPLGEVEIAPTSANATMTSTPTLSTSEAHKAHILHLEHITQAITIPAPPHHRHHHSHSHSHAYNLAHDNSHHHSHSIPYVEERDSAETARAVPTSTVEDATAVASNTTLPTASDALAEDEERESVSSSGASMTSDDVVEGDGEESPKESEAGFLDEEDEEEEEEERSRLTALSAGVEKIARHHKEDQSQSQSTSAAGTPMGASS